MAEVELPAAAIRVGDKVHGDAPVASRNLQAGLPGANGEAAALHRAVLGTSLAIEQIHKVKMLMSGKCSMGISFWPDFSFKPPEREGQCGTVTLVLNNAAVHPASSSAAAAGGGAAGASCSCSHLLHINFTRDPPDEVSTGAKFLGCIPFPFLTIRTNKLEGTIDPCSGAVRLQFEAAMLAQVGSRPPTPLPLSTCLTSEPASAFKVTLQGQRMLDGRVTLVSAAEVPQTGSRLANLLLWLPTAATAILPMRLEFLE
ncbi:hypothetical protein COO60DRAFT_649415 [Scenedesmus sp. NREL 46B-D3]|nr:hypothetical protein COO60DRAFT_649415 [Scenedesmus sp. NREL 46B-D3]